MPGAGLPARTVSLAAPSRVSSHRVLCETVKDFVARVGKAYEKTTESSEESEVMAKKVCPRLPGWEGVRAERSSVALHSTLPVPVQCSVLKEKLDSLLKTLDDESQASSSLPTPPPTIAEEVEDGDGLGSGCGATVDRSVGSACPARPQIFRPREQLMLRANSLKKAIRQIIEHTEKGSWSLPNKGAFFGRALGTPPSFLQARGQKGLPGSLAGTPPVGMPPHLGCSPAGQAPSPWRSGCLGAVLQGEAPRTPGGVALPGGRRWAKRLDLGTATAGGRRGGTGGGTVCPVGSEAGLAAVQRVPGACVPGQPGGGRETHGGWMVCLAGRSLLPGSVC